MNMVKKSNWEFIAIIIVAVAGSYGLRRFLILNYT